ncbi:BapA/Bap/LapF family large adhesin [Pseudomonas monteilii]
MTPTAPANLALSADGLSLTGTGIPGATVNVRGPDGTLLGSTVVGADGNFTVPLDTPQNNGQTVVVDQTDPTGATSDPVVITAPDTQAPAAPANLQLSTDGLTLTGTGEPGATVTVRGADGSVLGTAVVAADGTFSIGLSAPQLNGQTLTVDQTDAAGNVSADASLTAADVTPPAAPANLAVSADGLSLSGTGEPGATVTVRGPNGAVLGTAVVGADGTFSVPLGAAQTNGQTLSVEQTDAAGNVSPTASALAPTGVDAPPAPTALALSADGLTLTGRGEPGDTVTVRSANGAVLGTAVVAADGTFSVSLGSAQLNGETLSVVQANPEGLTSPAATFVAADVTAPAAPTGLQVGDDGLTLTGTGEPGATVTVRGPDGSVLGTAIVAANGSFTVTLGSAQLDGQALTVTQTDAAGNTSVGAVATAPTGVDAPPAPADLALSADGLTLSGTGQPGNTVTVRAADGSVLGTAVVGADGTFTLTLATAQLNGETLSAVQTNAAGLTSTATAYTAADVTAPDAPTDVQVANDGLSLSGRGEPGATVTVRDANGVVLGTAVVAADGTFTVALGTAQLDGQQLSVEQTDAAGNVSPVVSASAPIGADAPDAPTNLALSADGLTLSGVGEPGNIVTVRGADGSVLGTAVVGADGTFAVTLATAQLNGETLSAVQANATGATSPSASYTAADVTAPDALDDLQLAADGVTLTGTGEPGATVNVRDASGSLLGSTVVNADGTFTLTLTSAQLNGQTLSVEQTDRAGNTSVSSEVVAADVTAPAAPANVSVAGDGLSLSGTGEPGATVTVRDANGAVLGTAVVAADGTFTVDLGTAQLEGQPLSVEQTDTAGNVSPTTAAFAPIGADAPDAPTDLALSADGLTLSGVGQPGATVTVRGADGSVLGSAVVGADGTFAVTLSTAQLNGETLTAVQADTNGATSPSASYTAADVTAPDALDDLQLAADGVTLTGTGEPGATVNVRDASGTLLGSTVVNADGTFTLTLNSAQLNGQTLSVEQTDRAGNTSVSSEVVAADVTAPAAPANVSVAGDGLSLSGTGEPGATVTVRDANGAVLGTAVVAADGTFTVDLGTAQLEGQQLSVEQTDTAGNVSPTTAAFAPIGADAPDAPTDLALSADGLTLSGVGQPGATVTVRGADGSVLGSAVVGADGTFAVTLSTAQLNGESLTAVQADASGATSPSASYTAADVTAPQSPGDVQLAADGVTLTGTGEPGATVNVRDASGTLLGSAIVGADGTFSVTLSSAQLNGQTLSVDQVDRAGNASATVEVQASDVTAPSAPTSVSVSNDGLSVSGIGEPGATVTVRDATGAVLGTAVVAADGTFTVDLGAAQLDGQQLSLQQTDAAGNVSPVVSAFAPVGADAPDAPTNLALSADGLTLSGVGQPGATVTVRGANGDVLGTATVGADGTFAVTLSAAQLNGETLTAVQADATGATSPSASYTAADVTAPQPPSDLLLASDGVTLTGTGEPGATVTVRDASGSVLGTAVVAADGTFSATLSSPQLGGQTLSVEQTDRAGNASASVELPVADVTAPSAPGNVVVAGDGLSVSGTGEPGATVTVRDGNGAVLGTAVVAADGTFTVDLAAAQLDGQSLTLDQTDAAGNVSPTTTALAPIGADAPDAPAGLTLSADGLTLSGTGEAGNTVTVRAADGTVLGTATVGADGTFAVTLSSAQLNGETLTAVQANADGATSPSASYTAADVTAPEAPAGLTLTADGLTVTGTGEPGATVTVRGANGNVLGTGTVATDGTFSVILGSAQLDATTLSVTQADAAGNASPASELVVADVTAPAAPTALQVSADGLSLSGLGEPGATVTVRDATGAILGTAVVGANGAFTVTLGSAQLEGQTLTAEQADVAGNVSPTASALAPVGADAPEAPAGLALSADGLTLSGTGEPGDTITVRGADEQILGRAVVGADGRFSVTLGSAQLNGETLSVVQTNPAGASSPSTALVAADVTAPQAVTGLQLADDGRTLTGLGEPGARVTVRDASGAVLGIATVAADGTFSVPLGSAQQNGQALSVVQADAAGNASPATSLAAPDVTAPVAPAALQLAADGVTLTGTGEPGATVNVRDAQGTVLGTGLVGADGTFSLTLTRPQLDGQNLTVQQTDAAGNLSPVTPLTVADLTAPTAPTQLSVASDGLSLSGRGEAGATVNVRAADGTLLGSATVAADGTFTVALDTAQQQGQPLSVEQIDAAGNVSPSASAFAPQGADAPDAPTALALSSNGLILTGSGEAGATVTVRTTDGRVLGTALVGTDGTFSITLDTAQLNGETLDVRQATAGGTSPSTALIAADVTAPAALDDLQLSTDGRTVTGTGEAGATVTARAADGRLLGSARVADDGTFRLTLSTPQLDGQALSLSQADAAGNASPNVVLDAPDVTAPSAPADAVLNAEGRVVSGRGEPGATVTVRAADGTVLGTAVVAANGVFDVTLDVPQRAGQRLTLEQTDAAGNTSAVSNLTAADTTAPLAPSNLQVAADGLSLTGTGEPGARIEVRSADGSLLGSAVVAADGTFSVSLGAAQLAGQVLSVSQTDTAGNLSPVVSATAPTGADAPAAPAGLQLSEDGLTLTGTGEAGATVTVRGADGTVLGTAVVGANGAFSLTLGSAQLDGEELRVTQTADGQTSASISLTAPDVTAPGAPTGLALGADGLTLTGTGEPGATVTVRDAEGRSLGSAQVAADGSFRITLDSPQLNGQTLQVEQLDRAGNLSTTTPLTSADVTAPVAPTVLQVGTDGLTLTGRGEAGATVTVRGPDGAVLGSAQVGADGTFSVTLSTAQRAGQALAVEQADAAGNLSPAATAYAPQAPVDGQAPAAPGNLQISADGLTLRGTGEAGATVTVRGADGGLLGTAVVAANGTFSVALGNAQLDGQTLTVVQTDVAGNSSPSNALAVPDVSAPVAPTGLQVGSDGLSLSGTGEAGATVTVRSVTGALLGTAVVADDGTFVVTLNAAQVEGQTLDVTLTDRAGNVSLAASTTAPIGPDAPEAPGGLQLSANGLTLSGTGEIGATVTVRAADGSVLGTAVVRADGTFSVPLSAPQLDGQTLTVAQADAQGNTSPSIELIVADITAPVAPTNLQVSSDGTTLNGTGEVGATVTVRGPNGAVLGTAVVGADGTFSVPLATTQTGGQSLSVQQADAAGNLSGSVQATAPSGAGAPPAPVGLQLSDNGLTLTGTGTPGTLVTVRGPTGATLGSAAVAADGSFVVNLGSAQLNGERLTAVLTNAAGNASPSADLTAPDVTAPAAPTDLAIDTTGLVLTGAGEPGAQVTVRAADGSTLGTALVDAQGRFTVELNAAQQAGQTLSVEQTDPAGNLSGAGTATAPSSPDAPEAPTGLFLGANGSTLNGTGQAGATVTVRDADGNLLGSTVVAADGSFTVPLTQAQLDGQTLTVVQDDGAGNVSPSTTVQANDVTAPVAATAVQVSADGVTLSGTGEAGATVTVRGPGGVLLGTAVIAADGSFSVPLGTPQTDGQTLSVTLTDPAGNVSPRITAQAPDGTQAPAAPAALQLSEDGLTLSGTGAAGTTVSVRGTDGTLLGSATVGTDGRFSVELGSAQRDGETLNVVLTDAGGNASPSTAVVAADSTAPGLPTDLQVTGDGLSLTGTGEIGATVTVRDADGTVLGTAVVAADGRFEVPLGTAQQDGQTLSVTLTDTAGNTSAPGAASAPAGADAPAAPDALQLNLAGTALSGTGVAGATVTVRAVDGSVLGTATVAGDGTFSVDLASPQLDGEVLSVTQATADGTSPSVPFTSSDVTPPAAPTDLVFNDDGTRLTGTAEAGATVQVRGLGNSVLGTAVAAADGSFTLVLSPALNPGQSVSVIATDTAGNASTPAPVTAPGTPTDTVAPDAAANVAINANGNLITGSGEVGTLVTVTNGAGVLLGTSVVGSDGAFAVVLTPAQDIGQPLSVTLTDLSGNVSTATALLAPNLIQPQAPADLAVSADGAFLTGRATPGLRIFVRSFGGRLLGSAVTAVDGTFVVSLSPGQTDGQALDVTAVDARGNVAPAETLAAPDLTPPAAVTALVISPDGASLAGKGQVGAAVTVRDPAGTVLGTGTVDDTGGFRVDLAPPLAEGQAVTVVQVDASGLASDEASAEAPGIDAPTPATGVTIDAQGTTVTGTGAPGSTVEVRDADGNVLGSAVVDDDGTFNVPIATPQTNGQALDVVVLNPAGESLPTAITATDSTPPAPADTLAVNPNGLVLSGQGEAGASVTVRGADGAVIATGDVGPTGTFSITLPVAQNQGERLEVTLTDASGNASAPAVVNAPDVLNPLLPGGVSLDASGTQLSGIGQAGSTITVRDADGAVLGSATVGTDGVFTVPLNTAQTNGESLSVIGTSPAGQSSDPVNLVAPDTTIPAAVTDLVVEASGDQLSGRGEPGAQVVVRDDSGAVVGSTTVTADGSFVVPLTAAPAAGQPLQVVQIDPAGNRSEPVLAVAADTTPPAALVDVSISADGSIASGTGEVGVRVEVFADGQRVGTGQVGDNGRFQITLTPVQANGQALTLTQTDAAGNVSPEVNVNAPDIQAPDAVTDLVLADDGLNLTGAGEPGATVQVRDASGAVIGTGTVEADGRFALTLDTAQLNGQALSVAQVDASDNVSPSVPLQARDITPPEPVQNLAVSSNGATLTGTGEVGARVTVTGANGAALGSATVAADGSFSIALDTAQVSGQTLTVVQTDAADNVSSSAEVDAPVVLLAQPSALLLDATGTVLSGNAAAGVTVEVRSADGTLLGRDVVANDGTFDITLNAPQLDGETLQVVAIDGDRTSLPVDLVADDTTPPAPVSAVQISADGVTVSGNGDPGSLVTVTRGGATLGTATVDDAGVFVITLDPPAITGDALSVVARDEAGNEATAVALDGPLGTELAPPTNLQLSADGLTLTGSATAGGTVTVLGLGGVVLGTSAAVAADGTFNVTLSPAQTNGQTLNASVTLGDQTSVSTSLVAADTTAPEAPVTTVVAADGSAISGRGEAGASVRVTDANGTLLGTATVSPAGVFTVTLAPAQANGQALTLTLTDAAGNVSAGTSLNAPDIQPPAAPTDVVLNAAGTVVSGRGEAGASVQVRSADGTVLADGVVDASGAFRVTLPAPQLTGATLRVELTDAADNTSPATALLTPDRTPPAAVTDLSVSGDGSVLVGRGEVGARVEVRDASGTLLGTATVAASGDFSVRLEPAPANGQTVEVVQVDAAGNVSVDALVNAPDISAPAALTNVVINGDGQIVTGKGEPGATVFVRGLDGTELGSALVNANGSFSVTLNPAQINAEPLTINQEDPPGNEGPAIDLIAPDLTPPAAPSELALSVNGLQFSGSAEAGSTVTVSAFDGRVLGRTVVNATGRFQLTLEQAQLDGQVLSVTARDAAGNVSPSTLLTAVDLTAPGIPMDLSVSVDGSTLSGLGEPGALITVSSASGVPSGSATVTANGTFNIPLIPPVQPGTVLSVAQSDAAGNVSGPVVITAPGELAPDTPSDLALSANGLVVTGTGTAGSSIAVHALDGQLLGVAQVNPDGSFRVNLTAAQLNGEVLTVNASNADGINSGPNQLIAADLTPPAALTDYQLSLDGLTVTGRGETGARVIVSDANGLDLGTAVVGADGRFSVTLDTAQLNGQTLSLTQTDGAGNESAAVTLLAADRQAPLAATDVAIDQTGTLITGVGEAGSRVTVTNAAGLVLGTGVVRVDGTFAVTLTPPQINGQALDVTLTDAAGNVSPITDATAIDTTAPLALSNLAFNGTGTSITGRGEAGAVVTARNAAGDSLGTVVVGATGAFTLVLTTPQANGEAVTLVQADASGNVSPTSNLVAPDITAPLALQNVAINAAGSVVTGTGEVGAQVTVRGATGTVLGSGTVQADGSFVITLNTPQINLQALNVQQADGQGNLSPITALTAPDLTPPAAATNLVVASNGTALTGSAEAGAQVRVSRVGGEVIDTVTVGANGTFSVTLTPALVNGEALAVVVIDPAGNLSPVSNLTVPDITAPNAVTGLAINLAGTQLSGLGEAGATVEVFRGATRLGTATVDASGNFVVTLSPAQVNGQLLSVVQADAAGNTATAVSLTAPDTTPPAVPTNLALAASGLAVTGVGEAGARVQVTAVDQTVLGVAQVGADGRFSVTLSSVQANGQTLTVRQVDAAGNSSPTVALQAPDTTAPIAVADLTLSVNGLVLSGTGEAGATVRVNGVGGVLGTATVGSDGTFAVTLASPQLNGQALSLVQVDAAGNVSPSASLTARDVTPPGVPVIETSEVGFLIGTAEAGARVTVTTASGTVVGTAVVEANGSFAVVYTTPQETGAPLTITVRDAANNVSTPLVITSPDVTPPLPVTDLSLNAGFNQLFGRGEAGATVTVRIGNGTALGSAVVGADGTFVVTLSPAASFLQVLNVTQVDASNNPSSVATITVPLILPPETPTNLVLDLAGTTLTGRATPNVRIDVFGADRTTLLGSTTVADNGTFSVQLSAPQTNGQSLTVTANIALVGPSLPAIVIAADTTPPVALGNVSLNGAGTIVNGSGEAGATAIISNAAGVELGRAVVGANGLFSVTLSSAQTNGQVLSAVQVDGGANRSPVVQLTAADTTAPVLATNLALNAAGTRLTGTGEAGAVVRVTSGTTLLGLGTVAADGTFAITLTPPQTNGQSLGVTLTDAAANVSGVATLVAADTTPPVAPANLALVGNGLQLTGTGEAGAIVSVSTAAGAALGSARVGADGNFSVLLASPQTNGQVLTVRQADAAGNLSPTVTTTAGDTTPPALAGNLAITGNGVTLSGTGEVGAQVTVTNAAGQTLGTATVGATGQFSVTLSTPQLDGQLLNVRLTDAAQNVSAPAVITAPDTTPPVAPASATVNAVGTLVSGTGIAGDRIVVKNGAAELGTTVVAANGSWSLALNPPLTNFQALTLTQLDAAGNVSPALVINAPDTTPPVAASGLQLSTDGLTLSGAAEVGATVSVRGLGGTVLGTAVAQANGSFSVGLRAAQINGETLTVVVTDGRGNASPAATLVAPDIDADRPVVASDNLTTATVTLAPVTSVSNQNETFPTLLGVGFTHTFNFTVAAGTTAKPTLTLTNAGVLDLSTQATYTLQVKDASGVWQTIGTTGSGGLLDLQLLSSTGVRISAGTLQAGEYRLNFVSNSVSVITNIESNLRLDVTSLTQFQGTAGAAITGNVITDLGTDGTADITGPDNGAVLRVQSGSTYVNAGTGTVVQGLYGTLTLDGQGNYSYRATGTASSVGKVDVFNYQLVHPNGLSDTATLYVRIDSPQAVEVWNNANLAAPAVVVDATNDLASTRISLANLETTTTTNLGTVTSVALTGGSGQYGFTVSPNTVSDLTLTLSSTSLASLAGSLNLSLSKLNTATGQYALVKSWNGAALVTLGGGSRGVIIEDQTPGTYRVNVSVGGLAVLTSLNVSLTNVATYTNQFVVGSYTPVTGNLLTDTAGGGADVLGSAFTTLSVLAAANTYVQPGYNGTSIAGTYGTLLVKADGSYAYTLNAGLSSTVIGQTDTFTYRLTHPNGTSDTATLTVGLNQAGAGSARMALASVDDDTAFHALAASDEHTLLGTDGNDTLDGSQGGAITLSGGDGDDTLIISDLDFVSVDGGAGTDTLLWAGGDAAIDLGELQDRLSHIEVIDLNDTSAVDLTVSLADLVSITDSDAGTLLIKGNDQDSVHLSGDWKADGLQVAEGLTYTQYTPQEDPTHQLWVQNGIHVV